LTATSFFYKKVWSQYSTPRVLEISVRSSHEGIKFCLSKYLFVEESEDNGGSHGTPVESCFIISKN
jgi:hypothetical protein